MVLLPDEHKKITSKAKKAKGKEEKVDEVAKSTSSQKTPKITKKKPTFKT